MPRFEISYRQTAHERYSTDMNKRVRKVLWNHGLEIMDESGGSGFSEDPHALVADASFVVDTTLSELSATSGLINEIVGRDVSVREIGG